jgi:hypothetical protein
MRGAERRLAIVGLAAALTVFGAGVAFAGVSDGNYRPERQGCTGDADDANTPDHVEPGCQNLTANVRDGNDDELVRVGFQQTADGENVDPTSPQVTTGEIDPTTGVFTYFGADDNLDSGEHDGSEAVANGPSDGGAIVANVTPLSALDWLAQVAGGDTQFFFTHPLPAADAGAGGCADGLCFSVQTQRRIAYKAGRKHAKTRSAADYEGHQWDPPSCAGPSDTTKDCGGKHDLAWWHKRNQTTYVEPGLQIYEDPDPQGSPAGPYPLPALYIGTCGFVAGGGRISFPDSPITNGAGQLVVKTGC